MQKPEIIRQTYKFTLPRLAGYFFEDGQPPEWEVRQLTHLEYFRIQETESEYQSSLIRGVAEALLTGGDKRGDLIKEIMGAGDNIPPRLGRMIDAVCIGTVSPVVEREDVLTLFENWPVDAMLIAQKILQMTGEGATLGKPKRSTIPDESIPPLDSPMCEENSSMN